MGVGTVNGPVYGTGQTPHQPEAIYVNFGSEPGEQSKRGSYLIVLEWPLEIIVWAYLPRLDADAQCPQSTRDILCNEL